MEEAADDAELAHLDARIAAQFEQLGWKPAGHETEDGEPEPPLTANATSASSKLGNLLVDLVLRIDRLERHLVERDQALSRSLDATLSDLSSRMTKVESSLEPAAAAAEAASAALEAAHVELLRAERPLEQVGTALEGVQAALRAQARILSALGGLLDTGDPADREAVVRDVAELREQSELLSTRLTALERFILRATERPETASVAGGGASEPGRDGGTAGGDLGDEVVEPQRRDVDRRDERVF
jgi:hypothetical protein